VFIGYAKEPIDVHRWESFLQGFVTSGGTEGNFSGLWWNRDFVQNGGHSPILLTSNQTRYSVSIRQRSS
jgi:hypothetical protein